MGRFTPVEPVVNHLKRYNVKLGFEIPKLINFFSSFAGEGVNMRVWSDTTVPWPGYLTINTYEDGFLTLAEQRITGTLNVVSAAMWGMRWAVHSA